MERPQVVIIGGGFSGIAAARRLASAPVRITLIDRSNHHLFQPLLYQVAIASLAPSDIAEPIRSMLRNQENVAVRMANVTEVDLPGKRVHLVEGDGDAFWIPWDKLVVAAGVSHSYFGHDDWAKFAPGLKTLGDALEMRRRVLLAFERAEWTVDPEERRALTTFVVVGGGPTGVELAGALAEIAFWTLRKDFRNIDTTKARVILVEGGPAVLPSYPPDLQERARKQLERLGVEVRTRTLVTAVDERGVRIGDERLHAGTVLWGAGVKAEGLSATLGVPLDKVGRVPVRADCSLAACPDAFVVGDLAVFVGADGKEVPGVCQGALQMGDFAGACIIQDLDRVPRGTFVYNNKGSMATIGRSKAVVDLGFWRVGGVVAWLLWVFVHILFLITFRNRLLVMTKWAWAWVTFERAGRLLWDPQALGSTVSHPGEQSVSPGRPET